MINYVIINGVNSNTKNGLGINELPPITKPSMRTQTEEIDGRDGDIITKLGYSAYDKTITIGLFGTGYDVNDIISFFTSEGTITFSNEPDKYYKFTMLEQIDVESLLRFKTASITFHCQPFKYPLSETPLEIEYDYIEQTGENLNINNTAEALMKLSLKGNTSQYSTTGKNKLPSSSSTIKSINTTGTWVNNKYTINGITFEVNDDGTIKATGTSTNIAYIYINNGFALNGSFTLSSGLGISSDYYARVVDKDNGYAVVMRTDNSSTTATINTNCQAVCYVKNGLSNINVIFKPMIRLSSITDDTYEPYTNGASPNPDYPQPINVVSGDNEITIANMNLINLDDFTPATANSTITKIDTGINIKNNSGGYAGRIDLSNLPTNTDYYIQYKYTNISSGMNRVGVFAGNTQTTTIKLENDSNGFTFNTGNNTSINIWFYASAGTSAEVEYTNIQLKLGSTSTPYTPYTSQTYPIYLPVENYCSSVEKPANANLKFIIDKPTQTFTISFTSNEELSNNSLYLGVDGTSLGNVGGITGSANTRVSKTIELTDENYQAIKNGTNIELLLYKNGANFNIPTDAMVEKGSKANHYTPYGTTPIELCKIGDYQDYFTKNSDGQWCKYNIIGKRILNGSEGWDALGIRYWLAFPNKRGLTSAVPCLLYSNYFNPTANAGDTLNIGQITEGYYTTPNYNIFFNYDGTGTDVAGFKTWLSTHNTIVYYVLNTPYLSLIEDNNLIEQLDNIQNAMSYSGQTNIGQVNNDKPFIISAKAIEKGTNEVVVNNIGNAYSKPLIALEGNGNVDIYLNDNQILQANVEDKMNIDIDTLEAYNPDTSVLLNRQVIGNYNSMTLPSGNSTIRINGALDKATITNYQRWL